MQQTSQLQVFLHAQLQVFLHAVGSTRRVSLIDWHVYSMHPLYNIPRPLGATSMLALAASRATAHTSAFCCLTS